MDHRRLLAVLPEPGPRPEPPLRLELARGLIQETQRELRARSDDRREAIVLWAGRPTGRGRAVISHLVLPRFASNRVHLTIPPPERHHLANWLRDERLLIFSDLHTHPRAAFLSAADIAAPFSIRDGFYATVIPEFAKGAPGVGWRSYEALAGQWREVSPEERFRELSI